MKNSLIALCKSCKSCNSPQFGIVLHVLHVLHSHTRQKRIALGAEITSRILPQFQLAFAAVQHTPRSVGMCLILLWGVAGWLHAQAVPAQTPIAGDFKTVDGKEYKNATVSRVEPDGLVLTTKFGISKVYFVELPKEVQERFQSRSPSPSPSDRVFLTERVRVRPHSGLVGFLPGTALHVISKNSDTSHVTDGTLTFDVPNNKLTTDANLAARLAHNNYAAAEAAAQDNAQQMEAYRRVEAIKKAEQDRQIAAARQVQQQQQAEIERQDQAAARQAEQQWQAELQRRRDKEDYIFRQQNKRPDVIVIPIQQF